VKLDAMLLAVVGLFLQVKTLRFFNVFRGDQATRKQTGGKKKQSSGTATLR
jgi:hypothetical protein